MGYESSGAFVAALRDLDDEGLRTVATYDHDGHEFLYRRENVEALYTEEMLDEIHGGLLIEWLGKEYFESLFAVGEFQCALYGFRAAYVFHFVGSEYDGLVVSLDTDADVPLGSFVDACEAGIDVPPEPCERGP